LKKQPKSKKIMSKIQIGNLQPAGVEMFQGSESFLTELKSTEAHQIHGGKKNSSKKSGSKSGSKKSGSSKSGSGSSYSGPGGCVPVPPICLPCGGIGAG
jgi:uncharacterized membrane protein